MAEFNGVMMQFFHWHITEDGSLWKQLQDSAGELSEAGITALWLPPACKGSAGGLDVGYSLYDLFDLGEFDQKGSVRTKYGTRDEFLSAITAAQNAGMQVYADIIMNHKMGGDEQEEFKATPFNPDNRLEPAGELQTIKAWTHFNFPGRKGKYSELQWHWWLFNAAEHNVLDEEKEAVYLFEGKKFDENVDKEMGNADFLMGCNIDINNPDVQKELFYWGEWFLETTGIDGFRFDAAKHVSPVFFLKWLRHLQEKSGRELFAVGEYWSYEHSALKHFLDETERNIRLFDVTLLENFAAAGKQSSDYDLQTIFDGTLVQDEPLSAVTLVTNHDSQPLQTLESVVEDWFKPLAYALILLRKDGYPCIFYADYYGAHYKGTGTDGEEHEIWMDEHKWIIDKLLHARKKFSYGDQYEYLDHPDCIGWTRTGNEEHTGGMAVVMSNGDDGKKVMKTGSPDTSYIDITEQIKEPVATNSDGVADFRCNAGSVSVWVPE